MSIEKKYTQQKTNNNSNSGYSIHKIYARKEFVNIQKNHWSTGTHKKKLYIYTQTGREKSATSTETKGKNDNNNCYYTKTSFY